MLTGRHDEANQFFFFGNFANVPKNHTVYQGNNTAVKSSLDTTVQFLVLLTWL